MNQYKLRKLLLKTWIDAGWKTQANLAKFMKYSRQYIERLVTTTERSKPILDVLWTELKEAMELVESEEKTDLNHIKWHILRCARELQTGTEHKTLIISDLEFWSEHLVRVEAWLKPKS